jgi:hypothetical protein
VAEDFHVLPVAGVQEVHFDAASQTVQAVLLDAGGRRVRLQHPYTSRGQDGAEGLLGLLGSAPQKVRFVSGAVRRRATGLVIHPVCLVSQEATSRTALQPWVDRRPAAAGADEAHHGAAPGGDPLGEYLRRLQEELGDLLVLGLQRADATVARRWQELQRQGEGVGLIRVAARVAAVAEALAKKSHTLNWDWQEGGRGVLQLSLLVRTAQDLATSGGQTGLLLPRRNSPTEVSA